MKRNSRLSLALHALSHMAVNGTEAQTSADIAAHAGTNPVVVRRVLGKLRKAGLLTSERGHSGGWRLARPPDRISLADVYIALDESLVATEEDKYQSNCAIEKALRARVSVIMQDVERTLVDTLSGTSIADIHEHAE